MIVLTPLTINRASVDLAQATIADTQYTVANDGTIYIFIDNLGGQDDLTVTFVTPGTVDGLAISDKAVTVVVNDYAILGPFPPQWYNNSSGVLTINITGDYTTSRIKALKL